MAQSAQKQEDLSQQQSDQLSNQQEQVHIINDIVENKLGFGYYQKRALFIMSMIDFNDGCEYIIISIVLPIIRDEWNNKSIETNPKHQHTDSIDATTFKWLTTIVFVGMFIGSLLTGYFSDKYGRRIVIMYCSFLYSVICFYSLIINHLFELFIQRFLQGLIFAITIPLSATMFSEISPVKYRGFGVMFINFGITMGILFGIILSWLILEDINQGNWRLLTACQFIQGTVVFIGAKLYMYESPRYLMLSNNVKGTVRTLNEMISINKNLQHNEIQYIEQESNLEENSLKSKQVNRPFDENTYISQQQYNQLTKLGMNAQHQGGDNFDFKLFLSKFIVLFNIENRKLTFFLGCQWFFTGFIAFGQVIALSYVYKQQNKKSFSSLFISFLGEIPSYLVFYYIFNRQGFSRKNALIICHLTTATFNFLFYFEISMTVSLFICRLFQRCSYILEYTYTNEIYSTNLRATGVGFQNTMTRCGVLLMPFIVLEIVPDSPLSAFLLFGFLSSFCVFCAYNLPIDTSTMRLDEQKEQLLKQQSQNNQYDIELNQI